MLYTPCFSDNGQLTKAFRLPPSDLLGTPTCLAEVLTKAEAMRRRRVITASPLRHADCIAPHQSQISILALM